MPVRIYYAIFIPMIFRSFIAIEISPLIQSAISRQMTDLKKLFPNPDIRWVPTNNIHLTLKFLGDVSTQDLDILAKTLSAEINQLGSFSIPFSETGVFPNARKPRIIWIGLSYQTNLVSLHKIIEATTSRLGFPSEERSFSPHITLGRVSEKFTPANFQKLLDNLRSIDISSIAPISIDSITIFKSDLKPNGPVYSVLNTIPLMNSIY